MTTVINNLVVKIQNFGWTVEEEGVNEYRVGKYSPAGQDFSISMEGEDTEELINSINQAYEDFDVSEETYLWLDHSGHGKNRAPYHMKDVLNDMEACEQMILNLYKELTKTNDIFTSS